MNVPTDSRYAKSHEWIRPEGDTGTVGITDHAQHELQDVVYVELPAVGKTVAAGEQVCVVESVKAASDIYSPVSGTVTAVNDALSANPELVNTDPHGAGWIYRMSIQTPAEVDALLSPADYDAQIAG